MQKPTEYKYKIRYKMEKPDIGAFTKDQAEGGGLTDCLLIGSVLHPPDGSYSQTFYTFDGRKNGEDWDDKDLFKFWILMASRLANSKTLDRGRRDFADNVFETFRQAMFGGRD